MVFEGVIMYFVFMEDYIPPWALLLGNKGGPINGSNK